MAEFLEAAREMDYPTKDVNGLQEAGTAIPINNFFSVLCVLE